MNLKERKEIIDEKLKNFLSEQEYERKDIEEIFDRLPRFILRGGKRIRPSLFLEGYKIGGGEKIDECLEASLLMELWHNSLLIFDDMMDRDDKRRGGKTIHKSLKDQIDESTAVSHAINVGEYTHTVSIQALARTNFPEEKKYRIIEEQTKWQKKAQQGQALDLILHRKPLQEIETSEVLKMYELKTASYTVIAPLKSGYLLSPEENEKTEKLEKYGKEIGKAFQIKDDLLGLFGKEEETGKPVTSDMEEGKRTLPLIIAYKNSSKGKKETLKSIIGKKSTKKDLKKVREIVEKTGAKRKSENLAKKKIKNSKEISKKLNSDSLSEIEEFVIERDY